MLGPSVQSAFERIGSVLSKDSLALIDQMRDTIGVRAFGAKLQAPAAEHLAAIQRALTERRGLHLRYYSMSRDETTTRRVDPYHLTLHGGGFYLVAYCHLREAVRIFAVERMRELEVLAARFTRPEKFDVDKYLDGRLGDHPRRHRHREGRLRAAALARYIRDRLWHPTQKLPRRRRRPARDDAPGGRHPRGAALDPRVWAGGRSPGASSATGCAPAGGARPSRASWLRRGGYRGAGVAPMSVRTNACPAPHTRGVGPRPATSPAPKKAVDRSGRCPVATVPGLGARLHGRR